MADSWGAGLGAGRVGGGRERWPLSGSGSESGAGCAVLMPPAPRRPSGPAGVPVRQVAGAFAGTGI